MTLMGWIEGDCPPGRRMAVSDAFCVLDNLLTAHVLAADAVTAVQPEAEVTMNTSSSSVYEHDRMLIDLLQLREAGIEPGEVDRYIDERRALHDAAFPPRHAGEAGIRRFFAAVSPYGAEPEPGRGPAWPRLRQVTRRGAPRRVVDAVHASARPPCASTPSPSTGTTRWPATPCASRPGARPPAGATGPSGAPSGTSSRTRPACAPGAPPSRRCGRGSRCGWSRTGWRPRCVDGRAVPREDGMDRPALRARAPRGGGRRRGRPACRCRPTSTGRSMDNYEWGTYEPRFGLFGMDRSDPPTVRWLDTDARATTRRGSTPVCWRACGPATARCSTGAGLRPAQAAGVAPRRRRRPPAPRSPPSPCGGGG